MPDQHTNFAYSTIATAPSPASSGTSLVVASGDGSKFPAVPFNAVVWPASTQPTASNAEIVRVTARSTDTFTITRTQESTSARSITVGDQIGANMTAKLLTDIEIALPQWEQRRPATPHSGDDEFDSSSLDAAWTQIAPTSGTASWAQGNGTLTLNHNTIPGGDVAAIVKSITISSGGYIETVVRTWGGSASPGTNPQTGGLILTDGTTTSSNCVYLGAIASSEQGIFFCGGTVSSINSTPGGGSSLHALYGLTDRIYLRLIWQASNTWRVNASLDGNVWDTIGITDVSKTMTPTHMGFAGTDWGTGHGQSSFEYLRCNG